MPCDTDGVDIHTFCESQDHYSHKTVGDHGHVKEG